MARLPHRAIASTNFCAGHRVQSVVSFHESIRFTRLERAAKGARGQGFRSACPGRGLRIVSGVNS